MVQFNINWDSKTTKKQHHVNKYLVLIRKKYI